MPNGRPERILHIVEASFAGVGRHVLDLAHEQAVRGNTVHVAFGPARESQSFRAEREASTDVMFHEIEMTRSLGITDLKAIVNLRKLRREVEPTVIHGQARRAASLLVPSHEAMPRSSTRRTPSTP